MPEPPQDPPPYTVYRSRPRLLSRDRAQGSPLEELRGGEGRKAEPGKRRTPAKRTGEKEAEFEVTNPRKKAPAKA
jgi:hypothetical protein